MLTSATRTARPHSTAAGPSSSSLPLLALAAASFGIGTTGYAVMGLLPDVAVDPGVSVPKAGLLVSGDALSAAFGSPFLAMAPTYAPLMEARNPFGQRNDVGRASTAGSAVQIAKSRTPAIPGASS